MTRLEALERLLGQIGSSCDTLANFAAHNLEMHDDRALYTMCAVQAMAERIGAMAALADSPRDVATHIVGEELAEAIVVRATRGQPSTGSAAIVGTSAISGVTGVDLLGRLLRELRKADDSDMDEVGRNRHSANLFLAAVDAAGAGGGERWPDFAKAVSYVLRICAGGVALKAGFDLSRLVQGLDMPRSDAEPDPPASREGLDATRYRGQA